MKGKVLLILSLLIIFGLTLQNGADSANLSTNVQIIIYNLFSVNTDYKLVRRLAHIPEYFLLGMASSILLKDSRSFILCICTSFIDEVIKSFIPTKEFDLFDMCFDFIGYTLGIIAVLLFNHITSSTDIRA